MEGTEENKETGIEGGGTGKNIEDTTTMDVDNEDDGGIGKNNNNAAYQKRKAGEVEIQGTDKIDEGGANEHCTSHQHIHSSKTNKGGDEKGSGSDYILKSKTVSEMRTEGVASTTGSDAKAVLDKAGLYSWQMARQGS